VLLIEDWADYQFGLSLAGLACALPSTRDPDCDAIATRRIMPDKAIETFSLNHASRPANTKT
jgi:hypothetical protein